MPFYKIAEMQQNPSTANPQQLCRPPLANS